MSPAIRSAKRARDTLRQAPLGMKRRPDLPILPVTTPWGDVFIQLNNKEHLSITFGTFVVNRCTITGDLTLRKYAWQSEWFTHNHARSNGKEGSETLWNKRPLSPAQKVVVLQKLVPWILAWVNRNAMLFELDDELNYFRRYWDELQKDDPNGRMY